MISAFSIESWPYRHSHSRGGHLLFRLHHRSVQTSCPRCPCITHVTQALPLQNALTFPTATDDMLGGLAHDMSTSVKWCTKEAPVAPACSDAIVSVARSKRFGCQSRFLTEGLVRDLSKLTLVAFVSSARK